MKKPIILSLLCLAMGATVCLGACDDGGTTSSSESSSYVDPYELADTLGKAAIAKIPSVFDQEEFHIEMKIPSNYGGSNYWTHLEKDANGFYFYRLEDGEEKAWDDSNSLEVLSAELSEDAAYVLSQTGEYFFKDGDKYYVRTNDDELGDIEESVYNEAFNYFNVLTNEHLDGLFNGENFRIESMYGNRFVLVQNNDTITSGEYSIVETEYEFYMNEPKVELSFYLKKGEDDASRWQFIINYPESVQEFVDLYTADYVYEYGQPVFDGNGNTDDFGYNVSKLQALHTELRGKDHKITLSTGYYDMVDKIAAGNYYVKVTSATEVYNQEAFETQYLTQTHEYWNKDGEIKRVNGDEELYFNVEDDKIVKKLTSGEYFGYTDVGDAGEIKRFARFQDYGFMHYLTWEYNRPSYSVDKDCFTTTWYYETQTESGGRLQLYNVGGNEHINVAMTYDEDSFVINLAFKDNDRVQHNFIYEFSQFGEADFTAPTDTTATVEKILDEITATNDYAMGTTNYAGEYYAPTRIIDGQGSVEYPGVYHDFIKKEGKYYLTTSRWSGYDRYEVSKEHYEDLLPASSYVYAELFDKNNYTASGDGYTYSGKNFDATVEIVEDKIVLTVTENRIPALHSQTTPITLSFNAGTVYLSGGNAELDELPEFSLDAFKELTDEEGRRLGYSSYDENGNYVGSMHIDGNVLLTDPYNSEQTHCEFENGNWYAFHRLMQTYHTEYLKVKTDVLSGYNANLQKIMELLPDATMRYVAKDEYLFETADDYMLVYYNIVDGEDNYNFTFSDGSRCGYSATDKEVAPYADDVITHMGKSIDEIKADIHSKNYVYTEGDEVYALDGKNYIETTSTGLNYYIKNQETGVVYGYGKTLNSSGIFTYEEKGQMDATFSPDEIIALVNSGLASTCTYTDYMPIFADTWYEFENKAVAGIDGVENCKFTYDTANNAYTISINDGARTITLAEVGNVTVEKPSEDKMTLFAESMQYNNTFTWKAEARRIDNTLALEEITKVQNDYKIYYYEKSDANSMAEVVYASHDSEGQWWMRQWSIPQNMWVSTNKTEDEVRTYIAGLTDEDIATLLNADNYILNDDGTYTYDSKQGERPIVWQWDYAFGKPKTVELLTATVTVGASTLTMDFGYVSVGGVMVHLTFTFSGVNNTNVNTADTTSPV